MSAFCAGGLCRADELCSTAPAAEEISAASPTGLKCDFISCDVRQFSSIKAVCEKYTNGGQRASLDFLTLSCTRGGIQGFRPTAEGYDERLMTMYLARFGFVHALVPLLLKSEGARVISIVRKKLSNLHRSIFGICTFA